MMQLSNKITFSSFEVIFRSAMPRPQLLHLCPQMMTHQHSLVIELRGKIAQVSIISKIEFYLQADIRWWIFLAVQCPQTVQCFPQWVTQQLQPPRHLLSLLLHEQKVSHHFRLQSCHIVNSLLEKQVFSTLKLVMVSFNIKTGYGVNDNKLLLRYR